MILLVFFHSKKVNHTMGSKKFLFCYIHEFILSYGCLDVDFVELALRALLLEFSSFPSIVKINKHLLDSTYFASNFMITNSSNNTS